MDGELPLDAPRWRRAARRAEADDGCGAVHGDRPRGEEGAAGRRQLWRPLPAQRRGDARHLARRRRGDARAHDGRMELRTL